MTNLSLRQKTLANLAKKSKTTIDVGCDHGFIGTDILESGKTKFLIASDISKKCAEKTKKLLEEKKLTEKSSIRVGDGVLLEKNEKADQIIIAGMGGREIVHILSNFSQKEKIKHWIFQPMKEILEFRKFLNENNFKILKDFILKDKQKFYHIITAKNGKQKLNFSQLKWGLKPNKNNEDYFEWLNEKERKIKKILENLPKQDKKINEFLKCLEDINIIKSKRSKSC